MEISFADLKEKEVINIFDGKKLGRIIDLLFDTVSGTVQGIVVPGDKKLFRKCDDIFIPLEKLKKIGDDCILIGLQTQESVMANSYPAYQGTGYVMYGYNSKKTNSKKNYRKNSYAENLKANYQNFNMQNNIYNDYDNKSKQIKGLEINKGQSQSNKSYIRFHKIKSEKYKN